MFKPLLFVMNPRRIQRAFDAINSLAIDKVWFSNMWERDLVEPMAAAVEEADERGYTHVLLLADDTVPTQRALDLVTTWLAAYPIVTGYCNLDAVCPFVNLTKTPFKIRDRSAAEDYDWFTQAEVDAYPYGLVPTKFAGACLTGYSVNLWKRFPFRPTVHEGEPRGYASDWNWSIRVQDAGLSIVAPRGAYVEHLKLDWRSQSVDLTQYPEKRLLIGVYPPAVRWDIYPH